MKRFLQKSPNSRRESLPQKSLHANSGTMPVSAHISSLGTELSLSKECGQTLWDLLVILILLIGIFLMSLRLFAPEELNKLLTSGQKYFLEYSKYVFPSKNKEQVENPEEIKPKASNKSSKKNLKNDTNSAKSKPTS